MSEKARGCGFRQIGGLYLVSDAGFHVACDALPLQLLPCGCCGFIPARTRGFQWLKEKYLSWIVAKKHMEINNVKGCQCRPTCPICYPYPDQLFGFMNVGKTYYTPDSFIKEAFEMGVSKRIPEIPKDLKLGETWILLAHKEVPVIGEKAVYDREEGGLLPEEPKYMEAIFYAFRPQRVEMPLWKGDLSEEELDLLRARGISPVLLDPTPENKKRHKKASLNVKSLLAKWQKEEEEEYD